MTPGLCWEFWAIWAVSGDRGDEMLQGGHSQMCVWLCVWQGQNDAGSGLCVMSPPFPSPLMDTALPEVTLGALCHKPHVQPWWLFRAA